MSTRTLPSGSVAQEVWGAERSVTFHDKTMAWKGLFWKEFKQILPLLLALIAIGAVLQLSALFIDAFYRESVHRVLFILIPVMFAVGVGPMAVSQEKELGTISWLGMLPVQRSAIVITKIVVGFVALGICYLVGCIVVVRVCPSLLRRDDLLDWYAVASPSILIYFAILSFSLAWICPTAISTLITLVSVAALSNYLAIGLAVNFGDTLFEPSTRAGIGTDEYAFMFSHAVVAVLVARIAWRNGSVSFVSRRSPSKWIVWWDGLGRGYQPIAHARASTQGLVPSLLWQIAKQNRMILVFALAVVLSLLSAAVGFLFFQWILLPLPLLLCWLGASVFGSDGSKQRIRFLADRGVSPGTVWWTRQILPFSLVVLALGSWFTFYAYAMTRGLINHGVRSDFFPPFIWPSISFGSLAIYAFTQWSSQWTRSAVVSFCLSPVIALGAIVYGVFVVTSLGTPLWLVAVSTLIAFVASRVMMQPWMDGRISIRYWLSHATFLFAALFVPTIPFLVAYVSIPGMPSNVQYALLKEANGYGQDAMALELVVARKQSVENGPPQMDEGDLAGEPDLEAVLPVAPDVMKSVQGVMGELEQQLASHEGPIVAAKRGLGFAYREAALVSLRIDQGDNDQTTAERYIRAVVLLDSISERLRLRGRLLEQEFADRLDFWLVGELQKSGRRAVLGSENYSRLVWRLANKSARDQARRRAILMSWARFLRADNGSDFGGLESRSWPAQPMVAVSLLRNRYFGRATYQLLQCLEQKEDTLMREEYEKLSKLWRPSVVYVSDDGQQDFVDGVVVPGSLWNRAWERNAQSLASEL